MRYIVFYIALLWSSYAWGQSLQVQGGVLSSGSSTVMTVENTDLINEGTWIASEGDSLVLVGSEINISGTQIPQVYHLKALADVFLFTDLNVQGNLLLEQGVFDLQDQELTLGGNLENENESNRLYASGVGEVRHTLTISSGDRINPAQLGFEIVANQDQVMTIYRGHEPQLRDEEESIERYYRVEGVNGQVQFSEVAFQYLDVELFNQFEDQLNLYGKDEEQWVSLNTTNNSSANRFEAKTLESYSVYTLFEADAELFIPNGFSPNGDGVNDVFEITGVENFPNNKLIIFNQWGEVLYTAQPYENDWGGTSDKGLINSKDKILKEGTYFYYFFKDKDNKDDVIRSFVEIRGVLN